MSNMEQYIQPFIDVCINVFKEFIGVDLIVERPYISDQSSVTEWDVSGVIGLTGEARGAVVISMKKDLALRLTTELTGTGHTEFDSDVADAIGEVINIIAGNAKRGLEETFRLVISLPTIIQGKQHSIKWPTAQTRIICIPFQIYDNEWIHLSVAIEAV
ncbi:chemotaxis protein CheX [Spirochaetia bacterium]|nr:chemotaxis protein CheX [Spirochaetia bacterium]